MKRLEIVRFQTLDYACSEAINTLCTNLSFSGAGVKKILVTSCESSEGKTFLTMNMMRTFAELGKRVVLVDADLRRSMIEAKYGLRFEGGKTIGLAHYLAGMADLDEILYEVGIPGAYMVPVGREVSNSLSLLSTPKFSQLLDRLAAQVDFVLVDAPPMGVIIDAAEIAKSCDGTVLAVKYNAISKRELIEVKQQIQMTGCPILGAVLNNVEFDSYSSKKYYYKSYYSNYAYGYYKPSKNATKAKAPAGKGTTPKTKQ
ncbi:MAG: CpsD/CapB family tyrosine-protein kinase [Clostridia bacterium]|nr:CpsD/CapB family tyrosine-protein kinase [Clostridia bacterium]